MENALICNSPSYTLENASRYKPFPISTKISTDSWTRHSIPASQQNATNTRKTRRGTTKSKENPMNYDIVLWGGISILAGHQQKLTFDCLSVSGTTSTLAFRKNYQAITPLEKYIQKWPELERLKERIPSLVLYLDVDEPEEDDEVHIDSRVIPEAHYLLDSLKPDDCLPETDLLPDASLSINWCSSNMVGGFRLVGTGNVACYLQHNRAIVIDESLSLYSERIPEMLRQIIESYNGNDPCNTETE